jgi:hypothetical protein
MGLLVASVAWGEREGRSGALVDPVGIKECQMQRVQAGLAPADREFLASFTDPKYVASFANRTRRMRVGVILRGETFRAGANKDNRETKTLCAWSPVPQFWAATKYREMFDKLVAKGFDVDAFLATYSCSNSSLHFAQDLPLFFGKYIKRFEILEIEEQALKRSVSGSNGTQSYSQEMSLKIAAELAFSHMLDFHIRYDFLLVTRLDFMGAEVPSCILERNDKPHEILAEDFAQVIPGMYIPCYRVMVQQMMWEMSPMPFSVNRLRLLYPGLETAEQLRALSGNEPGHLDGDEGCSRKPLPEGALKIERIGNAPIGDEERLQVIAEWHRLRGGDTAAFIEAAAKVDEP